MTDTSKKIKEEFGLASEEEAVTEYASLNRDFMATNYPLVATELTSRFSLNEGVILDIGTGLGSLALECAKYFPLARVYGADISQEMLTRARTRIAQEHRTNCAMVLSDACNLAFEDNVCDLVVSFGALHHFADIQKAFLEMKRVLKEGAHGFVYDLRKDAPQAVVDEIASLMPDSSRKAFEESVNEAFSPSALEDILAGTGFKEYRAGNIEYSRKTLVKNKHILKESVVTGTRFNSVLMQIYFRK